ncbi:DoxX family protein [Microbacterium sp. 18062]|uniref:DoxX family protein n=1 Tax=Microbacterium sp. 18062 TaxID=2681410 RepID=UPI00135C6A7B|nr:DoxX family protein [Microbacterium sp. 18062]
MSLLPDPWWLSSILATALLVDVMLSLRPPRFIRDCLDGVGFPRDWWWILIVVKSVAVAGLLVGLVVPGVGLAAAAGVVCYFAAAAAAHLRARFLGAEFWLNCLGFLALAIAVLVFGHLL